MNVKAPPFGWPGGKSILGYSDLVKWIVSHLEAPAKRHHYIEPCSGMCGLLSARDPAPVETINDLDGDLIRFLRTMQANPTSLIAAALLMLHSRRLWEQAREIVADEDRSDAERSAAWMIVRAQSFGNKGGTWAWGSRSKAGKLTSNVAVRCAALAVRLERVQIEHMDACDLLDRVAGMDHTLIMVDPPYRGRSSSYATPIDHERLEASMLRQNGRVAMIGYAGDPWPGLEHWRQVDFTPARPLAIGAVATRRPQMSRLWLNWEPA